MTTVGTTVLLSIMSLLFVPAMTHAAAKYEDSLKQVAEGIVAEAVKNKKQRLAFLPFTDHKGHHTPIGQFLADELGTQVLVSGELNVVERRLVDSTLKKFHATALEPGNAKAVRRAAKAMRADVFVTGSFLESPDGLLVTTKLINPTNAHVLGAARGTIASAGPLGELIKDANRPPVKVEGPKEPELPAGLGFHRNEMYDLIVQSIEKQGAHVKLGVTVENRSPRDVKILCLLQETMLKDEHGALWPQDIEENRDGLCMRGLELSPREKERAVFTFTAPTERPAAQFTLHYHEKSPRRDATFVIGGLNVGPGADTAPAAP